MTIDTVSLFGSNAGYLAELYQLYKEDPTLVDPAWAEFFRQSGFNGNGGAGNGHAGYSNGGGVAQHQERVAVAQRAPVQERSQVSDGAAILAEPIADVAVDAFRRWGHLVAEVSPLRAGGLLPKVVPQLSPSTYLAGKNASELTLKGREFAGRKIDSVATLIGALSEVYCAAVGFEIEHLTSEEERRWLQERIESQARPLRLFSHEKRAEIFHDLLKGDLLESELHRKYVGAKRFSLEGNETLMPLLTSVLHACAASGVHEAVFGMAHRGRLNVLVNTLGKPLEKLFAEFEDKTNASIVGAGDVKYHLGYEGEFASQGERVKMSLVPNPSHLEFVNAIVEGVVRAKQDQLYAGDRKAVLPIVMHGDAAVAGQGIVFECLNYSALEGYTTGGTLHIVINNQIGFTTTPDESRSTRYCTDLAKGLDVPVFHVNAEDPESACWVGQLALEYRNTFGKDVFIDLVGHRKHGHNEGDDPSFTQPLTYVEVKGKKPLWQSYAERLTAAGVLDQAFVDKAQADYKKHFADAQGRTQGVSESEAARTHGVAQPQPVETRVSEDSLRAIGRTLSDFPQGFVPHPKLAKIIQKRVETVEVGKEIEWGVGEALAFGSLIEEGVSIRLSGQDCRRGTFSHRHAVLDDYEKPAVWSPFKDLAERLGQGVRFEVHNSSLSEAGVLGFEFGYAAEDRKALVMWEAQFGDFANGAQCIIDQFICSSEAKWGQMSGVTLLLPHGYEGQGPEHSSARLERFLQLCAENNMSVCYPTSTAQYFHLIRRQGLRDIKRPLVVMTPKSLLRFPQAMSAIEDLATGTFNPIIVDHPAASGATSAVVFVAGKVYYDVVAALRERKDETTSVVRIEELYPFPFEQVKACVAKAKRARCIWVQEEPKNQGAWSFVAPLLKEATGIEPAFAGRPAAAATATGSAKYHAKEQKSVVADMLAWLDA
jgi:2-oxoglutarate dehydrogenase E1 component